jgi:dTDP-4-amino-4,6-dideoxygalactose transaminase
MKAAIIAVAQWLLSSPRLYTLPAAMPWLHLGETRYHPLTGIRPLSGFSAALLVAMVEASDAETAGRQRTGQQLHDGLAGLTRASRINPVAGARPGYLRFPLRIPDPDLRARLLRAAEACGIAAGYPGSARDLPAARPAVADPDGRFPGTDTLVRELVTLPTHSRAPTNILPALLGMLA